MLGGNGGGAALGFRLLWRGETDTTKQVDELTGAWRRHVRDGLTCGGDAGVRPPNVERGQRSVGHDGVNAMAIRATISA